MVLGQDERTRNADGPEDIWNVKGDPGESRPADKGVREILTSSQVSIVRGFGIHVSLFLLKI